MPHLDQRIPLHPGEAGQLAYAVGWMLDAIATGEQPHAVATVLSLAPLARVLARLEARQRSEAQRPGPPPRKPRDFVVRYDELTALMRLLPEAPAAGLAWGNIQRASLNLERWIDFATG